MSEKLNKELVGRAVAALVEFEKKKGGQKETLFDEYAKPILVNLQLTKELSEPVLKPVRVKIPHSIFNPNDPDEHTLCLFCRSEDKEGLQKLVASDPDAVPGLKEIISINDVKKLYSDLKSLKKLQSSYTHFVCDPAILSHLYNKLGKTFGQRNNFPVPADYKKIEKMPAAVNKAVCDSTYMSLKGKSITIRLGLTNMKKATIVDNIMSGVEFAVGKLPKAWKDVHTVSIKLSDSVALPIWSKFKNEQLDFVKNKVAGADNAKKAASKGMAATGKGKKIEKETLMEMEEDGDGDNEEEEMMEDKSAKMKGKTSAKAAAGAKKGKPEEAKDKKSKASKTSKDSPIKSVNTAKKPKGTVVKKKRA